METPELQPDVFDPTADPRHRPATADPAPDADVSRPRDPVPDAVPPPDEPVTAPAGDDSPRPAPRRE